jgi:repressor LexA
MTVGERVKQARLKAGLNADELAAKIGKDRSTIYRYESNEIEKLPTSIIEPLSRALGVHPSYLMGWEANEGLVDIPAATTGVMIPVLGYVRAGVPMTAVENIVDYEEISKDDAAKGEHFGLVVKGDSMEPRFAEGDVVIVRKQETVENGEIAVVLVNGDDATVKKFYRSDNGIKLVSTNPTYDPFFYTPDEVDSLPVQVIGRVVELRAKF